MSHNQRIFAMDKLDRKRKTLEGGTFNATTAIIVDNIGHVTSCEDARRFKDVSIPIVTSCRRKTLSFLTQPFRCVTFLPDIDLTNI